ncbi:replication initiation protein, partial [Xanthomonas citri pv. citri]|nr:replication initiation protein [Xanthomonas citri pv. citri]
MADGTCSFCGDTTAYFFPGGLCVACTSKNARIRMQEQPTQSRELSAFDASVGVMQTATRRTEIAAEKIQKNKRVVGTSVREFDAAHPIALTAEGQRAALALGLVHYKTSDTRASTTGTVTIEIDPLQARAQRLRKSVITGARLHD